MKWEVSTSLLAAGRKQNRNNSVDASLQLVPCCLYLDCEWNELQARTSRSFVTYTQFGSRPVGIAVANPGTGSEILSII
jgi:hypothetical protein